MTSSRLSNISILSPAFGKSSKGLQSCAATPLLETLDLTRVADQRCEGFSKGMRQKVALAGALIHEPELLILDEPLTGLDASMARHVKELLQDRVATGVTVILTTHILEVAERLSDRIGIIRNGSWSARVR
jgi:ABC-2 type transport system ATP-binding protein